MIAYNKMMKVYSRYSYNLLVLVPRISSSSYPSLQLGTVQYVGMFSHILLALFPRKEMSLTGVS